MLLYKKGGHMKIVRKARKINSLIKGVVMFHKDSCCGARA